MPTYFRYPPTPEILQWLAAGKLAHRFGRSLRLWVLLQGLYSPEPNSWELSQVFEYTAVRSRLFAHNHPSSDRLSVKQVALFCGDRACLCHKTALDLVGSAIAPEAIPQWQQEVRQLAAWTAFQLQEELQQQPFATVHRSIRDDLKHLGKLGWLRVIGEGQYQCCPADCWPVPPGGQGNANFSELSKDQTWELLRVLESVAFVQPSLELTVQSLWEQVSNNASVSLLSGNEPQRRIFLHLDYILSPETQDRIDTYQEQIEQVWRNPQAGVIQFETWIPSEQKKVVVIVYPVCLHYLQRAKYLSAYGITPQGLFGWHNYRLDRIISERLSVLDWSDRRVPINLKECWQSGKLPTPQEVESKLEEAWGFHFYLPKQLLIVRFSATFAHWYVNDTVRHPTFQSIAYRDLYLLINREVKDAKERDELLEIVRNSAPKDSYYQAWIRLGDVNLLMRLQAWRPNGEVIAPLSLRQRLKAEALQEISNYQLNS